LKIKALDGQNIQELSMIEVAHALLEQKGKEMSFEDILNTVQDYLKKSDEDIKANVARFYTEMNTDGSFIPLGNNIWALRSWYAIDEIDEEVIVLDELEDDDAPVKKRSKINAFGIEDEVDPEDEVTDSSDDDMTYDDENPDDEKSEVEAYDSELSEVELNENDIDESVEIDEVDDEDDDDADSEA